MDVYTITVLANIALFSFLAISAWLLLLVGEISFGQQAYFAIGAYTGGVSTAVLQLPFGIALLMAIAAGGLFAGLVAIPAMRLSGLHFSIASLAFAELVRSVLNVFQYQRWVDGYLTGPDGVNGFRDIRWIYDAGIDPGTYFLMILGCLSVVMLGVLIASYGHGMTIVRSVGENRRLAAAQGMNATRVRIITASVAGAIAALGGTLYAHMATYIEPAQFGMMIGVHSLAYGLIGGMGTVFGPLLGVLIDIGALETLRIFSGYRMIVFGGLVALVLIMRPRGILDEATVAKVQRWLRG